MWHAHVPHRSARQNSSGMPLRGKQRPSGESDGKMGAKRVEALGFHSGSQELLPFFNHQFQAHER
jgi:hypothetical protein